MTFRVISARQHLIFDADDTLWENNIYFERIFVTFAESLSESGLSTAEIQSVLDGFELRNRAVHGYGARAYTHSLMHTYAHITGCPEDDPALRRVEEMGLRLLEQEMETIEGVADLLAALHPHHDLYLLTKGDEQEQLAKIERSGLKHFFDDIAITHEKSVETYRDLVARLSLAAERTWMIGNSPRSDINPALAAGINAVYVPHVRTWHLETEPLVDHATSSRQLIQLERFRDLATIFVTSAEQAATSFER